jgi:DNA-binding transcriptional regulator YiaG
MTPTEFKAARNTLGLTLSDTARILNTDPRTIRKWEAEGGNSARPPNPIACQVLKWMLAGWRPPEWPKKRQQS